MTDAFTDTIVCGGPSDFMEVRHLTLRGSCRDAGRALATIAHDRLGVTKVPWTDPDATRRQREWLRTHWRAQYERMLGVADAFGLDPEDDRIDASTLYYFWIVPGCSNVFYPPSKTVSGHAVLSRNYDFSTGTAAALLGQTPPAGTPNATSRPFVIEARTDHGYASLHVSTYELLGGCMDGMNECGLGVALLASVEVMQGPGTYRPLGRNGVGLHELQVPRFLLDTCATAAEARRALDATPQFYVTVPCHYLVADRHGDAFVWSHAARPDRPIRIDGSPGEPLPITNHLPDHTIADIPPRTESVNRLGKLCSLIDSGGERLDDAAIRRAAEGVAATLPAGQGQYQSAALARTLWHAFYDLDARTLAIDFYLGEAPGGSIRRSGVHQFALA